MLQIQLCMNLITYSKLSQGQLGIQICTWEPNSGRLYWKTELKHGLRVHQSMCRRLCIIQSLFLHENFRDQKFAKNFINPFEWEYDPLMDLSAVLGPILLNYYQTQIGVFRLTVELRRIDIITEVSMLASKLLISREDHLEAVFHMFRYLKGHHNARMVFDQTYPTPDMSIFQ